MQARLRFVGARGYHETGLLSREFASSLPLCSCTLQSSLHVTYYAVNSRASAFSRHRQAGNGMRKRDFLLEQVRAFVIFRADPCVRASVLFSLLAERRRASGPPADRVPLLTFPTFSSLSSYYIILYLVSERHVYDSEWRFSRPKGPFVLAAAFPVARAYSSYSPIVTP